MAPQLLITAVGADRPGLVDELTQALSQRQLNIETSRMSRLGGDFAMLVLVSGGADEVRQLARDASPLTGSGELQVWARETSPAEERLAVPFTITTAGMDHPGIVHDVASLLHRFGVGIDSMDTGVASAPNSGTPMFSLHATIDVPPEVRIRELREALTELGDELNMDMDFSPL